MIQFLTANYLWIALIVVFVAMHRRGHGCGMHRGNGDHQRDGQRHGGHAGKQHGAPDRTAELADPNVDESVPVRTNHGV